MLKKEYRSCRSSGVADGELGTADQGFDGCHSFAKIANSFQGCHPMGLDRCSKADDAGGAQDEVVNESKSEQRGQNRSHGDRNRIMQQEKERSDQDKKTPDDSEDDPSRALDRGDGLHVAEIESLIAFNQDQLFNQEKMI